MQKKGDKVDNKIPYKEERERKQRERERKIETESQVQIVACMHERKTKELFLILHLISRKIAKTHFWPKTSQKKRKW